MARKKPVVAVDFDDIVAGFNMAYHQWHNRQFGSTFQYSDLVTFDMCTLYGVDAQTLSTRVSRFVHEHHHEILPIEGVKEGLQRLAAVCDPQVVTSRCESLRTLTIDWIEEAALSYFSAHHFTCGFNSIYPERKRQKVDVCREIGAIALIDDADHNALEVVAYGLPVLMLERPWNGTTRHGLITRLRTWDEIADAVIQLV